MRDIVDDLLRVWHSGRTGGLATIVRAGPETGLAVGAVLVVEPDGSVTLSPAAAGLEPAAYDITLQAARSGTRTLHRLAIPGADPDDPDEAIDVFTEPFSHRHFPEFPTVAQEIAARRRVTLFTVVWNSEPGMIGQHLITDKPHATELVSLPQSDIFVVSYAPPPRLLIFGGGRVAAALARQSRLLDYRVTVCTGGRRGTNDDYGGAEIVADWPQRYLDTLAGQGRIDAETAIVVAESDPQFDIPLLATALQLPVMGYLGAVGSLLSHTRRIEDLRAKGFGNATLRRLHSPAGLALGAVTAAEIAVAVLCEILAGRSQDTGGESVPIGL